MLSGKVRVRPEITQVEGSVSRIGNSAMVKFTRPDKVLLVLQVEEAAYNAAHCHHDAKWRDAEVEDLSEINIANVNKSPTQFPIMPLMALLEIYVFRLVKESIAKYYRLI